MKNICQLDRDKINKSPKGKSFKPKNLYAGTQTKFSQKILKLFLRPLESGANISCIDNVDISYM